MEWNQNTFVTRDMNMMLVELNQWLQHQRYCGMCGVMIEHMVTVIQILSLPPQEV